MIRLTQAVVVEGKYDKIALENVIDATIIPTDGFGIFRDREKIALLRLLARRDGIIVMTDSDSAGAFIRSRLKQLCGDGTIVNVYIPRLPGKEKRKDKPGKEGLLGVEGMTQEALLAALEKSGVTAAQTPDRGRRVTKTDLFRMGLSGGENSAGMRRSLMRELSLPPSLSANAFLDFVNTVFGAGEFEKRVAGWKRGTDKK